jgi:hypothetical protein
MKPIKLTSLDHAGMVLTRLALRSRKTIVGMVPAVPLYAFCKKPPEDGVLIRYLFPVAGTITKVLLAAPEVTKEKPVEFLVNLSGPLITQTLTHTLKRAEMSVDMNFKVEEGDRLSVVVMERNLTDIEVSALFRPKLSSGERIQAFLDELTGAVDEGILPTDQSVPDGSPKEIPETT